MSASGLGLSQRNRGLTQYRLAVFRPQLAQRKVEPGMDPFRRSMTLGLLMAHEMVFG